VFTTKQMANPYYIAARQIKDTFYISSDTSQYTALLYCNAICKSLLLTRYCKLNRYKSLICGSWTVMTAANVAVSAKCSSVICHWSMTACDHLLHDSAIESVKDRLSSLWQHGQFNTTQFQTSQFKTMERRTISRKI